MPKKYNDFDAAMIERADHFEVSVFLGVGRFQTIEFSDLPTAREGAKIMEAQINNGRRGMIYAVSPEGRSTFVPPSYQPATLIEGETTMTTETKLTGTEIAQLTAAVQGQIGYKRANSKEAAIIVAHDPGLAGLPYVAHHAGWDSVAIDVDDRLIFKFPRRDSDRTSLRREARLIAAARPHVRLAIPDLRIVEAGIVFSRHAKIPGTHLLPEHYAALPEMAREGLAADMARFFADLHALPLATMEAAGARPVQWYDADTIAARALPLLDPPLRNWAETTLADWGAIGADPYGEVYGFFDGHGWNMAFDHERQRLNGVYDFGDSGIAPLHQEFIYPGLVDRDLIMRILPHYERETGRMIDPHRVMTLAGVHRLFEVAQHYDDAPNRPAMLDSLTQWART